MTTHYSYSYDGEHYRGKYATREEAMAQLEGQHGWTGRSVPPPQPETYWNADDWIEHVTCQDLYSVEWAAEWYCGNRKQERELEASVRKVMADWLDRHDLRPKFWLVEDVMEHFAEEPTT